jgi:hypothetical protein
MKTLIIGATIAVTITQGAFTHAQFVPTGNEPVEVQQMVYNAQSAARRNANLESELEEEQQHNEKLNEKLGDIRAIVDDKQRKKHSGYGTEYLTPYQEILERHRLAPGGAADVGRQLSANLAATAAANRANPLLAPRDTGLVPAATEVTSVSTEPNPLTRPQIIQPPVPLSQMPVEQQMAWQKYIAEQSKAQADLDKSLLEQETMRQEIARRNEEHRLAAGNQVSPRLEASKKPQQKVVQKQLESQREYYLQQAQEQAQRMARAVQERAQQYRSEHK